MQAPTQLNRAAVAVRSHVEAAQAWVEQTLLWNIWQRLLEDEFLDRSVALAAKAFVSAFPAIIVVASFMPNSVRHSVVSTITHRLGVEGDTAVQGALAKTDDTRKTTGILGLIFTFYYVNSFVTALQRVYQRGWRRPPPKVVKRYAAGAAWLAALLAYAALLGGFRAFVGNGPVLAFAPFALVATIAVWTLTPWLMLERHVRFRALLPSGLITGIGLGLYGATASLWMPRTVSQNRAQFGFFGIALALVTWLTGAATIIVVGTHAGAVLAEDRGWIGRLIRGGDDDSVLSQRSPERSSPEPAQPAVPVAVD